MASKCGSVRLWMWRCPCMYTFMCSDGRGCLWSFLWKRRVLFFSVFYQSVCISTHLISFLCVCLCVYLYCTSSSGLQHLSLHLLRPCLPRSLLLLLLRLFLSRLPVWTSGWFSRRIALGVKERQASKSVQRSIDHKVSRKNDFFCLSLSSSLSFVIISRHLFFSVAFSACPCFVLSSSCFFCARTYQSPSRLCESKPRDFDRLGYSVQQEFFRLSSWRLSSPARSHPRRLRRDFSSCSPREAQLQHCAFLHSSLASMRPTTTKQQPQQPSSFHFFFYFLLLLFFFFLLIVPPCFFFFFSSFSLLLRDKIAVPALSLGAYGVKWRRRRVFCVCS